MAAKKKPPGVSGSIHPAVIQAAGLDCDREEERAWIAERYNASFHPLPVCFAERFHEWNRLTEEERERQIEIEERDPRGGKFTMAGAMMGEGIIAFRERFARACATAATVGDREFFRAFDLVFYGLGRGEFPVPLRAATLRAWEFLTLTRGGRMVKWNEEKRAYEEHCAMKADFPTVAELHDYLEAMRERGATEHWPKYLEDSIRGALESYGLKPSPDKIGGDRRSKAIKAR